MNLLNETMSLIQKAPRQITYSQIARDTGLKVSWISDFANDKLADYGINKVQKLHDYLKSKTQNI